MSDKQALLDEKSKLITDMQKMQEQFIEYEHKNGMSGKDYYYAQDGLLKDYREKYNDMAVRLVDVSHELVGSSRWM